MGQHQDDAHAWPYMAYVDGEELRAQSRIHATNGQPDTDADVLCWFLFFDYDKGHDDLARLGEIPEAHYLAKPAVFHLTKGGARLVYRLLSPVSTEEYGNIVRAMSLDLWSMTGLQVDPVSDQWSRCFRLPSVTRADGKANGPTWLQPYWQEPLVTDLTLDPADLPSRAAKLPWVKTRQASVAQEGKPDPDQELPSGRRDIYRRTLKRSRFYEYVFEGVEVAKGRRDPTLLAMAGEVVKQSYHKVPESGPAEVFLLLLPVVQPMERDGEPWEDKLWRMVQHSWAQETAKDVERREQQAKAETLRTTFFDEMVKSLPAEEIPEDPKEKISYLQRHYCLQVSTGAYAVCLDGSYGLSSLKTSQLPAHFNEGMQFLVEGGFRSPQGEPLSGQQILNTYSTNVNQVEYTATGHKGAKLILQGGRKVLQVTPFTLREDLVNQAEPDPDIDGWLDSFPDPQLLRKWIAAAVGVHLGGVASLYLHGPARVGKSMFAQGIAECFHAFPIPGAQAFSEFNGALLESPVIMVDEGLPVRMTGMDTADMFRSMVTGGPLSAMRKHRDACVSKIPYRIIFAANSYDMVIQLIGRRTLSPQDRDAFRERILVIDTGSAPGDYLDSRGAMQFTKHHPKGSWLGGACRLARHFIHLHLEWLESGKNIQPGRLLVEGEPHPAFTLRFDLSGAGRDVVDALCSDIGKMVSGKSNSADLRKAITIDDQKRVWVKKRPYVKYATAGTTSKSEQFSIALDRFLATATRTCPRDRSMQQQVDVRKILFCSQAEGLETELLQDLQ